MSQGTLFIEPIQRVWTNAGATASGARAFFYLAGTTTSVAVYTDVSLSTPFTQPVVSDSNGIFAEIFLTPGTAYKVDIQTSGGVSLTGYPADNQLAIPASANTVDTTETAGEALTAGQAAYLSDGSGGKTQGQLYKGDSANTYSSVTPIAGIVPNSIAAGASGTFRTAGLTTGFGGLVVGADYFIGTAGAITTTPPTNARYLGKSDSTTSIIVAANPPLRYLVSPRITTSIVSATPVLHGRCEGRLTLTTGTPVTTADVTGATTIYFTPYLGNNIGLYDGVADWTLLSFSELSIALGTLTSGLPYDVFAYNNAGVVALRSPVAWSNTTTRVTALTTQHGVLVKTGATTDRYLGTFVTTSTTQTEDSNAKRLLWNYYNRMSRPLVVNDTTASWTYTVATFRQARATATNQLALVVGVSESRLDVLVRATASNDTGAVAVTVGIGEDSTTTPLSASTVGDIFITAGTLGAFFPISAVLSKIPAVGSHTYVWLEASTAIGVTTWVGAASALPNVTGATGAGISGQWWA